jgi:hypothetical protein
VSWSWDGRKFTPRIGGETEVPRIPGPPSVSVAPSTDAVEVTVRAPSGDVTDVRRLAGVGAASDVDDAHR